MIMKITTTTTRKTIFFFFFLKVVLDRENEGKLQETWIPNEMKLNSGLKWMPKVIEIVLKILNGTKVIANTVLKWKRNEVNKSNN